jgi:tRNA(Ile)-lysidine synthase
MDNNRLWVAFSGGLDSTVLLHLCTALRDQHAGLDLHAIHINHGLQQAADDWALHCHQQCERMAVSLQVLRVDATAARGESPEEKARQARYQALANTMTSNDVVFMAQHRDDQAETLLLQLLRGSGPHGAAGMPVTAALGQSMLARPLLTCSRQQLQHYAEEHALAWIEDPSNTDTAYDRNYLRHAVLPHLYSRWPALGQTLGRAADHFAEAAGLLDMLAADDLAGVGTDQGLSIRQLQALDAARQRNLLRYWFRQQDLPVPQSRQLEHILSDVIPARLDAEPCVRWHGAEVRRYRDTLLAMSPLPATDTESSHPWDLSRPLDIPLPAGRLVATTATGSGLAARYAKSRVSVRFRRGGEVCQPVGRQHHHDLKTLMQDAGIPPWQRDRIPLIFVDEQLAQVVGHWLCEPFQAAAGETGLVVEWHPLSS